jgi:hypothetical protein
MRRNKSFDKFPQTVRDKNTVILARFFLGLVSSNGKRTFSRKRELIRHPFGKLVPCGDGSVAHKSELIEVLEFTHFYEHFTFEKTDWSERGKHLKKYIRVIVAVELDTVGAKIEPTS